MKYYLIMVFCILLFSSCKSSEKTDENLEILKDESSLNESIAIIDQDETEAEKEANEKVFQKIEYKTISQEEAKKIMEGDEKYILLDVRTQEEYDEKHLKNSILIPDYDILTVAPTVLDDKTATILVYCRSGNRSRKAAAELSELGYTKIYNIGGINTWPYDNDIE